MPKEPIKRKVIRKEIHNAVFVDFEGSGKKPNEEPDFSNPDVRKFVGVLSVTNRLKLRQFVLDDSLNIYAKSFNADESGLCDEHKITWCGTRKRAEEKVIELLLKLKGPIISWSEHDWNVMENMMGSDHFSDDDRANIKSRWRNALQTVRPWNTVTLQKKVTDHKLQNYMEIIGYVTDSEKEGMSDKMSYLSKVAKGKRNPDELTSKQLDKWRHVYEHNFHDLEGMRQVLHQAVLKNSLCTV
ncbi:MAG: hypothetical protein CL431_05240 [Acidimicrobiaceae bacterium]|jgi:hypothetical protein|nr:hypothetical protein [Acidimicrobiaceae bacterium]|tara:strand:- start:3008 stop:3733 length:726 start_codon:yes stop_codon:yes gene_type:complete